ncbi:type I-C CRISPR-associated protein Cas7/Csd2 [Oceanidesulfovibrio marinus]|uniref:Type I-C CRISPR-associated protein Cas7/Csd2 n=1 Tax=Oceanidesulfovibrio marinus TaxID=370038 RepID=A0ABX6NI78_9BACT|nr:type I-C CRISPR-associated protein Cas7/Csd2 [Oceanidesulfovibrio marinus]QJT10273.1 type I-C CRISPR-associated protein Cas7/Csd2 [Oceanidesulfovibrio marinus]
MSAIDKRYDFVFLFDVANGNPNGDPDAGNLPRIDPETSRGLVTDVCLKRKIRNYVGLKHDCTPPFEIYVKEKAVLNHQNKRAYLALDLKPEPRKLPKDAQKARELTSWMCKNFFDVRTFGAVMTTDVNCGQVRGPVQLAFAHSIDPIAPLDISITRMAVTKEEDIDKERTMGRKAIVPYGLYRCHGFVSAPLAERTGFGSDDLALLWEALQNMFEHDHSAARGEMASRGLYVFEHENKMGNAPAHTLFSLVDIARANGDGAPPRSFEDYAVTVDEANMPQGVTLHSMI